jgi:hypothetical protein
VTPNTGKNIATSPTSPEGKKGGNHRHRKKSMAKKGDKHGKGGGAAASSSSPISPSKQVLSNMAENEDWSDKEGSTESDDSFGGGSTDDEIVDDPDWEEGDNTDSKRGGSVASPMSSPLSPSNQTDLPGLSLEEDALSLSLTTSLTKSKSARRRGLANSNGVAVDTSGKDAEIEEDPLGLNEIDLVAIERGRLRHKESATSGGQRRRGSLIGFNAKKQLLSSLRGGPGAGAVGADGKPALLRSTSGDVSGGSGGKSGGGGNEDAKEAEDGSILPTSTEFDPVSFLVLVHGQASLVELVRGQAYLQAQVLWIRLKTFKCCSFNLCVLYLLSLSRFPFYYFIFFNCILFEILKKKNSKKFKKFKKKKTI